MARTYLLQYDPHDDIVCDLWRKSSGWCRRKGGVEELRAFVEERSKGGPR